MNQASGSGERGAPAEGEPLPDCQACGACCHSTTPYHVRVFGADHARLGDDAERWVTWIGHRAYLRLADGACAALARSADTGRFACVVYEARPETCRTLTRGSPECAAERAEKLGRVGRAGA